MVFVVVLVNKNLLCRKYTKHGLCLSFTIYMCVPMQTRMFIIIVVIISSVIVIVVISIVVIISIIFIRARTLARELAIVQQQLRDLKAQQY